MSNPILSYYQKHRLLVEENLEQCKDPTDMEAIHLLRLSIKRIRIIAKLTDQISGQSFDAKKTLRDLNKFFNSSGNLRDIQITKELLLDFKHQGLDPIISQFQKRELKQRIKFEQSMLDFRLEIMDEIETRLCIELEKYTEKDILISTRILLSSYANDIYEIYHKSAKEERLHEIRTRLKDINYLNNMFDGQLPIQDYLNISVERLKELGELAGSWHDHLNLEVIFQKYLDKNPDTDNIDVIRAFTMDLSNNKEDLYQEYCCILMNEMKM
jgi:CHAD domain-containing protein